jgi:hypothetical protein
MAASKHAKTYFINTKKGKKERTERGGGGDRIKFFLDLQLKLHLQLLRDLSDLVPASQ